MFLKTLKVATISTFCVLSTITMFSGNVLVYAQTSNTNSEPKLNSKPKSETDKLLKKLKDNDPKKLESQKLEKKSDKTKSKNDQNTLVSDQKNLQIETELKTKKIKVKNTDKGDISLNMPNSDKIDSVDVVDNKVIYSGKNSPIDTIVESIDGGVRQVINIKDSSAPSFYDFKVDLEKGDTLELTSEGGAIVKSSKVDEISKQPIIKTFILKPWAKDANGKDLKTSYSVVNGNVLRQTIDLKGAVFPVTADPIWCGNAINYVTWIRRDWVWSASIYPTGCGMFGGDAQKSWTEVYYKIPSMGYIGYNMYYVWDRKTNYESMKNQYICHVDFARGFKWPFTQAPWNIEPATKDKGYWGFFWSACN